MTIGFIKNRKGMTLIELIVAIGILSIVTIGLSTYFAYIWRSRFDEISRGESMLAASQGISKISENIRKATQADSGSYAISSAGDFDFIFYSDIDADGNRERVHYYLSGNSMMMGTAEPILGDSPTYPTDDEVIVTIANNIMNTGTEPIFRYYNSAGTITPNISSIRLVKLYVSVNVSPGSVSNTVIETSVALRNLNK